MGGLRASGGLTIEHPELARAYEALERELAAARGDHMAQHTAGKTSFLRGALNDARLSRGLPIEHDWDEWVRFLAGCKPDSTAAWS
jgi:hypothetical protein